MAVVEIASFEARAGSESDFEREFTNALPILIRQLGYVGHEFGASIEQPEIFWLVVHWKKLEDHTESFRKSADFALFVGAFRQFLATPATVAHFRITARSDEDAIKG